MNPDSPRDCIFTLNPPLYFPQNALWVYYSARPRVSLRGWALLVCGRGMMPRPQSFLIGGFWNGAGALGAMAGVRVTSMEVRSYVEYSDNHGGGVDDDAAGRCGVGRRSFAGTAAGGRTQTGLQGRQTGRGRQRPLLRCEAFRGSGGPGAMSVAESARFVN